ncbi:hypothetical protein AGMMS50239_09700 [Bacteroidia bacterium]|nr:hypothetical protein AGMMS50239_09700 [Bacteroidia bacterium]
MFKYNYLTLPQSVQFRYGHRIEYTYDASGMKRTVKYKEANHDMNYYPSGTVMVANAKFYVRRRILWLFLVSYEKRI